MEKEKQHSQIILLIAPPKYQLKLATRQHHLQGCPLAEISRYHQQNKREDHPVDHHPGEDILPPTAIYPDEAGNAPTTIFQGWHPHLYCRNVSSINNKHPQVCQQEPGAVTNPLNNNTIYIYIYIKKTNRQNYHHQGVSTRWRFSAPCFPPSHIFSSNKPVHITKGGGQAHHKHHPL